MAHIHKVAQYQYIFIRLIVFAFILFIVVLTGWQSAGAPGRVVLVVVSASFVVIALSIILHAYYRQRWLKKRTKALHDYAAANGLTTIQGLNESPTPGPTLENVKVGVGYWQASNVYSSPEWTYYDYDYTIERNVVRGPEYDAFKVYYSVLSIELPRQVPNIFFDSKLTKEREYRHSFLKSQRHELGEGNFNHYFDSYFPIHYNIDALSFITPEVMEAMINASGYDIELAGTKLYLYSLLEPMPGQLEAMTKLGLAIKKELFQNIADYRDDRVAEAVRQAGVSIVGAELRHNLYRSYLTMVGGSLLILFTVLFFLVAPTHDVSDVLLAIGLGALTVFMIILFFFLDPISTIKKEKQRRRDMDAAQAAYDKKHPV